MAADLCFIRPQLGAMAKTRAALIVFKPQLRGDLCSDCGWSANGSGALFCLIEAYCIRGLTPYFALGIVPAS